MSSRQLILGTAGHIDHGKTALVRALTGIDTDRLPQEKARGITIDLGFAHLDLDEVQFGVVDVPGHERFIRNMLAGAAGIDLAMLVVAADDSVMPQTREHLAILEFLQIRHGMIVITKSDLVDDTWIELVTEEIRELTQGTFLQDAPVVVTSATTGTGIDDVKDTLVRLSRDVTRPSDEETFRMAIDRAFVVAGLGTVVTGTVWSGSTRVGDELAWLPPGKTVRIRGLQSHAQDVDVVSRGQRAAINLGGAHHTEVSRGHEIASPGYLEPASRISVRLDILPSSPWPIKHRARLRLHIGAQEIIAGLRLLDTTQLEPGETGLAQLICAQRVVATGQQPFVVRAESPLWTVGGGIVLQPNASGIRRRDTEAISRLHQLTSPDPVERAAVATWFRREDAWTTLELAREIGASVTETQDAINSMMEAGTVVALKPDANRTIHLHREVADDLEGRVREVLMKFHKANPLDSSVPASHVTQRLHFHHAVVVHAILARMRAAGTVTGSDAAVTLVGCAPKLSEGQATLRAAIVEAFEEGGFSPPEARDLAARFETPEPAIRPLIDLSVNGGELIHVGATIFLHKTHDARLQSIVIDALRDSDGMTMSEIRAMLGTTRKYAVPICEYLDRIGVTRRTGDVRVLGKNAR